MTDQADQTPALSRIVSENLALRCALSAHRPEFADMPGTALSPEAVENWMGARSEATAQAREAERLRSALKAIEKAYYTEGKDASWRAAQMRSIATEALNPEPPAAEA